MKERNEIRGKSFSSRGNFVRNALPRSIFFSFHRLATKRVYRKCYLYAVSGTRGNYVYDWIDKA